MSSISNSTSDISIPRPQMWKLALRIDKEGIEFTLHSDYEENSLIYRNLRFPKAQEGWLKNIEDIIYDNPILLKEYDKVSVLIESENFIVVPSEVSSEDDAQQLFKFAYPSYEGDIQKSELLRCQATILYEVEKGIIPFLERTYENPKIQHNLRPLCEYFFKKSSLGNVSKIYAYFHGNRLDLCAFHNKKLALTNSFRFHDINDAAYFIINVWQSLKFDVMADELQLSGDKKSREIIMPLLRKYITYVMPTIFPTAMFKAGKDAMLAPFDLIVLPLCE